MVPDEGAAGGALNSGLVFSTLKLAKAGSSGRQVRASTVSTRHVSTISVLLNISARGAGVIAPPTIHGAPSTPKAHSGWLARRKGSMHAVTTSQHHMCHMCLPACPPPTACPLAPPESRVTDADDHPCGPAIAVLYRHSVQEPAKVMCGWARTRWPGSLSTEGRCGGCHFGLKQATEALRGGRCGQSEQGHAAVGTWKLELLDGLHHAVSLLRGIRLWCAAVTQALQAAKDNDSTVLQNQKEEEVCHRVHDTYPRIAVNP